MLKPSTTPDRPRPAPRCPSCGSGTVDTTSKTVDASTYWRCSRCGEIWNVGRRDAAGPYAYRHR